MKKKTRHETQTRPTGEVVDRTQRTKQTKKENENQRNTKPCVRQSTEKQKRTNRQNSKTNKSVNATGRPTPCGQTPEKSEKNRRTKVKKQPALGQATKTPFQPVELECDHGHISC